MVTIGGIRTANGLGGMETNGVIPRLMSSLLAILGSHGGGVGAGVRGQAGATATPTTATAIMVTGTLTATTTDTVTPMAMEMDMVTNTALPPNREWPSYSADWLALAIIAGQSMESWDRRRGGQFGPTNKTTDT